VSVAPSVSTNAKKAELAVVMMEFSSVETLMMTTARSGAAVFPALRLRAALMVSARRAVRMSALRLSCAVRAMEFSPVGSLTATAAGNGPTLRPALRGSSALEEPALIPAKVVRRIRTV